MALRDIVPWRRQSMMRPEDTFRSFQHEMDRMFDELWGGGLRSPWMGRMDERLSTFMPSVDVCESKDSIEVTAELPGMSDEDIQVNLSPNADQLMLRGEKKFEEEKREHDFYRSERSYGSFQRTIALPAPVDPDKIEAKFRNGVLSVHLPKRADADTGVRQIAISK